MSDSPEVLLKTAKFDVVRRSYRGSTGAEHIRAIVDHPGAVTILPMVDTEHVCLIRNYRVAVDQTLYELPAGTREPDEAPALTASRELTEETGYTAGEWRHLHSFYLSPGILNERMELYLATDLAEGLPQREAGEEIENCVVPWNEAVSMALDGRIQDAKSLVGILLYDHLRRQ